MKTAQKAIKAIREGLRWGMRSELSVKLQPMRWGMRSAQARGIQNNKNKTKTKRTNNDNSKKIK